MKPSHIMTSILPSSASRIISPKTTCKKHADQPLDLFCIICRRVLCVHCKEYNHENCEQNKGIELELYRRGFLNVFVQSSEDLKIKMKSKTLSRVVYIPVFAGEARRWLKDVQIEVRACNDYFRELKGKQNDVEEKSDGYVSLFRSHMNYQEIDTILQFGEYCFTSIDKQFNDENSDIHVAMSISDIEQDCLAFFKYRRALPLDIEPFTLIKRVTASKRNIQQLSNCSITEICTLLKCSFVSTMTYNATHVDHTYLSMDQSGATRIEKSEMEKIEVVHNADISCFRVLSYVVYENSLFRGELVSHYYINAYQQNMIQQTAIEFQNNMYTNEFLEKSELRNEHTLELRGIHVDIGYSKLHCSCLCQFEIDNKVQEKPHILIFSKSLKSCLVTQFVNVAVLPCRSINEIETPIQGDHSERRSPYLFSFIGNRLESVFLYIDSNKDIKYGLAISSTAAKYKSSVPVYLSNPTRNIHQNQPEITTIDDKNGAFLVIYDMTVTHIGCHTGRYQLLTLFQRTSLALSASAMNVLK